MLDSDSHLNCPVSWDLAVCLGEMPVIDTKRSAGPGTMVFQLCISIRCENTALRSLAVFEQSLNLQLRTIVHGAEWDPSQWLFHRQGMALVDQWITTPLLVGLSVQIDLRDDSRLSSSQLGHRCSQRGWFNCSLPNGIALLPVVLQPKRIFLCRVTCGSGAICFLFAGLQELCNSEIFYLATTSTSKTKQPNKKYRHLDLLCRLWCSKLYEDYFWGRKKALQLFLVI